jgi:hypothetical protein
MSNNTPTKKSDNVKEKGKPEVNNTPLWKKHFLKLFLVLLLVVSVIWGWVANTQLQKEHEKEITELKEIHTDALRALERQKNKEVTQTLALAVRSELIDENIDQVNQYFLQVLKQPSVSKILLINHKTGKVNLSTNKKDEGTTYKDKELYTSKDVKTILKEGKWNTATPIMGLNNQLAVIVMVSSAK